MINPQTLRDDPGLVRESQIARGEDPGLVDAFLASDAEWRENNAQFDAMRNKQKELGKQVGQAKRAGEDANQIIKAGEKLAAQLETLATARDAALEKRDSALLAISNLVDSEAPRGAEGEHKVVSTHGREPSADERSNLDDVVDHVQIGSQLGLLDIERGAKVSGSRFYFLSGQGALLELALINMAMHVASTHGFRPIIAPSLVRPFAMQGTGFLGQAAENVYHLAEDDMYLVGTSEVALAAMHADEILTELPLRYAGFSPCFRREAGSHGKDTRGIMRVHWFDKVEMFSFVAPDQAAAEHIKILEIQKQILDELELPYRVVDIPTGDLGASANRKFDCEVWVPSLGEYREVTSASNCSDFQSRRLKIRTPKDGENVFVATLNGTAVAVPRVVVALLENNRMADGNVIVPKALRPYFGDRAVIDET